MRHSRRKRRIERIDVKRDVDRRIKLQLQIRRHVSHLDRLNPKLPHLFALVRCERPDPDLHQSLHQLLFHDSRKRRRVGITITLVTVVDIRMRVKVKHAQIFVFPGKRSDDRMRDRVIAAERDGRQTITDQRVRASFRSTSACRCPRLARYHPRRKRSNRRKDQFRFHSSDSRHRNAARHESAAARQRRLL